MNRTDLTLLLDTVADPVPVCDAGHPVAQGDVILIPVDVTGRGKPIPAEGVVAVAGTHNHVLVGDGLWDPTWRACDLTIGLLTADSDVYLLHIRQDGGLSGEHGVVRIAAGTTVELRGQQESAREGGWRRVAD